MPKKLQQTVNTNWEDNWKLLGEIGESTRFGWARRVFRSYTLWLPSTTSHNQVTMLKNAFCTMFRIMWMYCVVCGGGSHVMVKILKSAKLFYVVLWLKWDVRMCVFAEMYINVRLYFERLFVDLKWNCHCISSSQPQLFSPKPMVCNRLVTFSE